MRHRGGLHLLGGLLLIGIVATLVALAYGAGAASTGDAQRIQSGCGHFLGFLLAVLVVALVAGLWCRPRGCYAYGPWDRPGPGGPGGRHGRAGWSAQECRESAKSALDEWHRQAHAELARDSGTPAGDPSSQPGGQKQS
jgi:heme A synthase